MNIQELLDRIEAMYPFDEKSYPKQIDGRTDDEVFRFAMGHGLLHVLKSSGVIARELERLDHGGNNDVAALSDAGLKLLVNAVRILSLLGHNQDDVETKIAEMEKESALRRTGQ